MDDNTIMQWGKHKGTALANIPGAYFVWLSEQDFIKEPKGTFNKELKAYIELNADVFEHERTQQQKSGYTVKRK